MSSTERTLFHELVYQTLPLFKYPGGIVTHRAMAAEDMRLLVGQPRSRGIAGLLPNVRRFDVVSP